MPHVDVENMNASRPPRPTTASGGRNRGGVFLAPLSSSSMVSASAGNVMGSSRAMEADRGAKGELHDSVAGDALLRVMTASSADDADALLLASEKGDLDKVTELLRAGVDAQCVAGLKGFTPLHHACSRGHLGVAKVLLEAGASVAATTEAREISLHLAAYHGDLSVVELLLDSDANMNAKNEYDETPLFYAARRGQAAVVRLLLQRGADPEARSRFQETAADECTDERTRQTLATTRTLPGHREADGESGGAQRGRLGVLPQSVMVRTLGFLKTADLGRAGCVSGHWHRSAEDPSLWRALGVSRWELALAATLGGSMAMGAMATLQGFRPANSSSRSSSRGSGSRPGTGGSGRSRPSSRGGLVIGM
mmetsp:Transcript_17288/g.40558  ORF Transcript_17288/g.40558 Transcript_17288/m.40558 type:complete len:367 (-) Transcript_17288:60-1160(-)